METLQFGVDRSIIGHLVHRQTGNLHKAILEGVMNAADSGAKRCDITITRERVTITDNGAGMSREEIENGFAVFGLPQDPAHTKEFGQFRVGRGQMFSYGRNIWHTRNFRLEIDVEKSLDSFQLREVESKRRGCAVEIELYTVLNGWEEAEVVREVSKRCRYMRMSVWLNKRRINVNPDTMRWDHESPNCRVRDMRLKNDDEIHDRGLSIYHRGLLVETFPVWEFGFEGVVLATDQLMVNFARNEVVRQRCPVWDTIRKELEDFALQRLTKSKKLLDEESRYAQIAFFSGRNFPYARMLDVEFLRDAAGKPWSLLAIANEALKVRTGKAGAFAACPDTGRLRLAFILPYADRREHLKQVADVLQQQRAILTLDLSGCGNLASCDVIRALHSHVTYDAAEPPSDLPAAVAWTFQRAMIVLNATAAFKGLSVSRSELLGDENLTRKEQKALEGATLLQEALAKSGATRAQRNMQRRLAVGKSPRYTAWTDGTTFVAFARTFIRRLDLRRISGWCDLGLVLAHELAHDTSSEGTSVHGHEFYEAYHTISRALPAALDEVWEHMRPRKKKTNTAAPPELALNV
jgi:hypothetical protein